MNKWMLTGVFLMLPMIQSLHAEDTYSLQRQEMILAIERMVADTRDYTGRASLAPEVMAAMARVPRHEFIPEERRTYAYENRPLPIGSGQTISQPYIVALMTDLAGVNRDSVVLEVGTGSGYQAAVLAELAGQVYTIEIIEELGRNAAKLLQRLGYNNVTVRIGDGYHGWPEQGPFDAILVTAAPEKIPEPLLEQLAPGGRLIIPVGGRYDVQSLQVVEKDRSGRLHTKPVLPVGFVPLTGDH
ncbi:MAG: protein-L-isoaspartate O-methyltransferase [Gammaproteobacteria bacterium RIFCSPLOWO2_02_FULL_56_15]|nr:MAG: protein-L-isoaspartate O-methyltransferase [Gammaproteobacteria bacterium RIFCSPLOWO2_02_FULL_56_15]